MLELNRFSCLGLLRLAPDVVVRTGKAPFAKLTLESQKTVGHKTIITPVPFVAWGPFVEQVRALKPGACYYAEGEYRVYEKNGQVMTCFDLTKIEALHTTHVAVQSRTAHSDGLLSSDSPSIVVQTAG